MKMKQRNIFQFQKIILKESWIQGMFLSQIAVPNSPVTNRLVWSPGLDSWLDYRIRTFQVSQKTGCRVKGLIKGLKPSGFPFICGWGRVGWLAMIVKLYNSGVYIFVSFLHPSNKSSPTTMGNLIPSGCRVVLEFSPTCKVRKRD